MKKILVLACAIALVLGGLAGCSKKDAAAKADPNKKFSIVVMPKLIGIPYFNASETGAVQAGKDLGIEVIYTGPTTADAAEQVKMLEDYISKGVSCIAVAPNDAAALTPVLMKAKKAGIIVIDWDTPADQSVVDLSIHQIDDVQYGQHIWDLLVKYMGDKGEYALLTGGLSAANLNGWIDAGLAYAKTKYPDLKLVTDKIGTDEKQQVAYQKALDMIKAYPKIKGFIGVSTPAPLGAAQAVQEKKLQKTIAVVGTSLPTDSAPFLKDGSLKAGTLWDPAKLGYLTVALAYDYSKGKKPADGQDVPNVGKIQVKADGKTVIMGPPTDFLPDNVDTFKF